MEISIFIKSDSKISQASSAKSGEKAGDRDFEIAMKSSASSTANNASVEQDSKPEQNASAGDKLKSAQITEDKKGGFKGRPEEKIPGDCETMSSRKSGIEAGNEVFRYVFKAPILLEANGNIGPKDLPGEWKTSCGVKDIKGSLPSGELQNAGSSRLGNIKVEMAHSKADIVNEYLTLSVESRAESSECKETKSNSLPDPAESSGECARDVYSINESGSNPPASGKSSAKTDEGRIKTKADEAEIPANILAPPGLLPKGIQSAVGEGKSAESVVIIALDLKDASAPVFKEDYAGSGQVDTTTQLSQAAGKNTEDLPACSAVVKGDEILNSGHVMILENLPAGEKGKEASLANQLTLKLKKPNLSGEEAPPIHAPDKLKNEDESDSNAGIVDGITPQIEAVTAHKSTKSPEGGGKADHNAVKDDVRQSQDDNDPLTRSSRISKTGMVNEPDASTQGWFNSRNGDNRDKKNFVEPARPISPGLGQSHVNKITAEQISTEKVVQNIKEPEVFDGVADGIKMSLAQGGKEVRLSLHPEQLGKLNIKLIVEGCAVKVKIQVDNPSVKAILETDSGRLKEFFSHQGLTLEKCSIELEQHGSGINGSGGFNGGGSPGRPYDGHGRPNVKSDTWSEDADTRPYAATANTGSGLSGIDLFI